MESTDPGQFLLGCAAISWAAASTALFCRGTRAQKPLAACMMAAAMLTTADAMSPANIGVPLAAILVALGAGALAWSQAAPESQRERETARPSVAATTDSGPDVHDATNLTHTESPAAEPGPSEPVAASPTAELTGEAEQQEAEQQETEQQSGLRVSDVMRDLRNPLTSVVAAMQVADHDAPQGNGPGSSSMTQLRTYGRQLAMAMADIDDLELLIQGEINLAEDVFDLKTLLNNCIEEVAPETNELELIIRYEPAQNLPQWVRGDPSRIRQLCSRVLQLATHRCTMGPVDIFATADNTHIHVSLLNVHPGIETEDSLGVVFARELASTLGGSLTIAAREGGGTEFTIKLPLEVAPDWEIELLAEDEAATDSCQPTAQHNVTGQVLLVTGNVDHQRLLAQVTSMSGAEVTTAESGKMAQLMLQEQSFDLVLMDMQSNGEDGCGSVEEIRAKGLSMPIIALTSDCAPAFLERCLVAGCNGHLSKPVAVDLLEGALSMHLSAAE